MIVTPLHHAEWLDLRRLLFRLASFVAINAAFANFLPNSKKLAKHPDWQCLYEIAIFLIACFSLNWRACLPSLDVEFLGFKARREDLPLPTVRARYAARRARRLARRSR